MAEKGLSPLEKRKIKFEIGSIIVAFILGFIGVWQYFDRIDKERSDELYKDFITEGTLDYIVKLGKILDLQIGPATNESKKREKELYSLLAPIGNLNDLNKEEHKDRRVLIEPLTEQEILQLEQRYAVIDDILSTKLFFLGDGISKAIRASARLISEETPHYQSNILIKNKIQEKVKDKRVGIFDAYRYWVFVQQNYAFLKEALTTISDYILEQNYTSYKDYKGIQDLLKHEVTENSDDILIAFHNLGEMRERYYRYEDSEAPEYSGEISDQGKKLCVVQLIQFFEEYRRKKVSGQRPYVRPIHESKICTVFVKDEDGN